MRYKALIGMCMIAMVMLILSLPVHAAGSTQDLSPPDVQSVVVNTDNAVPMTTMLRSDGYGEFTLIVVVTDASATHQELLSRDILTTTDGLDLEPWRLVEATFVDGNRTNLDAISAITAGTYINLKNVRAAKSAGTNEYDGIHRLSAKRLQTAEFLNSHQHDEFSRNTDAGGHRMDLARINEGILENTTFTHRLTRVGYV